MGRITLNVLAGTVYTEGSLSYESDCYEQRDITVNTGGTDKHVSIRATDQYGSPTLINEVIVSDKQYILSLYGDITSQQNIGSAVIMEIRELTANGTLLATVFLDRYHRGFC